MPQKIEDIKATMLLCPDITDVEIEVKIKDLGKPEVINGKISEKWYEENISKGLKGKGYFGTYFLFSMEDGRRWGIDSGLRGLTYNDGDHFAEMWIKSHENSITKIKGVGDFVRMVKTALHEPVHEFKRRGWTTLEVHDYDYMNERSDLVGLYKKLRLSESGKKWLSLSEKISDLWAKIATMKKAAPASEPPLLPRLPKEFNELISQGYGIKNAIYKMTGVHIGIDYRCPVGTKITAPYDGEVVVSGSHGTLGNFCYYQYTYKGKVRVERYLHLSAVPARGKYKAGAVVALSGNTGMSTGPHFHVDGWHDLVDTAKINKTNWSQLTYNPHIKYETK